MPKISGNKIIFDADDVIPGLSSQYSTSIDGLAQRYDGRMTVSQAIDPFRALGFIMPGVNPTDVTTVSAISEYLNGMAIAFESTTRYAYFTSSSNKIQRMNLATNTISNAGSWPHTVTGASAEDCSDILTYKMNVGSTLTSCVLFSWNDNPSGTWNVGIFNTSAGTFDDDFMSSVPATPLVAAGFTKPHPMAIGADDIVYIGDGNKVHGFDGQTGADGTFEDSLLVLPSDMVITSLVKMEDGLAIFAYKNQTPSTTVDTTSGTEATCYIWNYLDNDPKRVISLDDDTVSCAGMFKNTLYCFTSGANTVREPAIGANRNSRLRVFNGDRFETVAQFIGNSPGKNGSGVMNDGIYWLSDGLIYVYGSPLEGVKSGLHCIAKMAGTSNGLFAIIPGINGVIAASTGATTSGGLQRLSTGYTDEGFMVTAPAVPAFSTGKMGKIKSVTTFFGRTASGGRAVSIGLVTENATSIEFVTNLSAITADNQILRQLFTATPDVPSSRFQDLRLYIDYSTGSGSTQAPTIGRVEVEFEEVNILTN